MGHREVWLAKVAGFGAKGSYPPALPPDGGHYPGIFPDAARYCSSRAWKSAESP